MKYETGVDVAQDNTKAIFWCSKAAAQGHIMAQYFLGAKLEHGETMAEAAHWYQEAATQGYAAAQFNLGEMYKHGNGVEQDFVLSAYWQLKAAEQNYESAHRKIRILETNYPEAIVLAKARIAEEEEKITAATSAVSESSKAVAPLVTPTNSATGTSSQASAVAPAPVGTASYSSTYINLDGLSLEQLLEVGNKCYDEKNYVKAFAYLQKAADMGNAVAEYKMGAMYAGRGIPKNNAKCLFWTQRAAERGSYEAQHAMGIKYHYGHNGLTKNINQAIEWYKKAAEQSYADSLYSLGLIYGLGREAPKDSTQASEFYRKAADCGHKDAQLLLAARYETGDGVEKDALQAFFWCQKAAMQGEKKAQNKLAIMYENGMGVAKDWVQAAYWYIKAIDNNDRYAIQNLGSLYARNAQAAIVAKEMLTKEGYVIKKATLKVLFSAEAQAVPTNGSSSGAVVVTPTPVGASVTEQAVVVTEMEVLQGMTLAQIIAKGKELYNEKKYEAALPYLKHAADKGNSVAQFCLGFMYNSGHGVNKDYEQSFAWYSQSALQGHVAAQCNLGAMYASGQGVTKDEVITVEWFNKAAKQGYNIAQYNLGVMYESGRGVAKDYVQASIWHRKAADQGNSAAQYNLGTMYANGHGVTKDDVQAVYWLIKAADANFVGALQSLSSLCKRNSQAVITTKEMLAKESYIIKEATLKVLSLAEAQTVPTSGSSSGAAPADPATVQLAVVTEEGVLQGMTPDQVRAKGTELYSRKEYKSALPYLQYSADRGDVDAQCGLGGMYSNGLGVEKNNEHALAWFKKAAEQKDLVAQSNLGIMYANGLGVTKNETQAVIWFQRAAEHGHANAQFNLGKLYYYGRGITKNYTQAIQWFQKAADQGNADAKFVLGSMYLDGQGVARNEITAIFWYLQAAEQNHETAIKKLRVFETSKPTVVDQARIQLMEYKAAKGDVALQIKLATMYEAGGKVAQDFVKAACWYIRAAYKNNKTAKTNLTILQLRHEGAVSAARAILSKEGYNNSTTTAAGSAAGTVFAGLTTEQIAGKSIEHYNNGEYELALPYLQHLAVTSNGPALRRLGYMYQYGLGGLVKDESGAVNLYSKAFHSCRVSAATGDGDAQFTLGAMYAGGSGVAQDYKQSAYWYIKASMSVPEAAIELNELKQRHPDVVAHAKAHFLQERTQEEAAKGDPGAQYELARIRAASAAAEQDYVQVVSLYYNAASQGHAEAQFALAEMYKNGNGIDKNQSNALRWFLEAGNQGHPLAQYNLGVIYLSGEGVEKDEVQALKYLNMSATAGCTEAHYILAKLYKEGNCVGQDNAQSLTYLQKSADLGYAQAQYDLGVMYSDGAGVDKDKTQATTWFIKAAELGHAEAQLKLGQVYADGEVLPRDYAQASIWYKKAAEQGVAKAQSCLAWLYETGNGVERNYAQAFLWYKKAAELGETFAQCNLGALYYAGNGVERNYESAIYWFNKAAENGYMNAQFSLGNIYSKVREVENYEKALYWYHKVAEKGMAEAQYRLGEIYETGKGVSKDMVQATIWYLKAADQNLGAAKAKFGIFGIGAATVEKARAKMAQDQLLAARTVAEEEVRNKASSEENDKIGQREVNAGTSAGMAAGSADAATTRITSAKTETISMTGSAEIGMKQESEEDHEPVEQSEEFSLNDSESELEQEDQEIGAEDVASESIVVSRREFFRLTRGLVRRSSISEAILSNEMQKQKRVEMDYIAAQPNLLEYYNTLNSTLINTFTACQTLRTGMISNQNVVDAQDDTNKTREIAVQGLVYASRTLDFLTRAIPVISHIGAAVSATLNVAIAVDSDNKVKRLLMLVPNQAQLVESVSKVSRTFTIAFEHIINDAYVEEDNVLIKFFKKQKDRIIENDIKTKYQALAVMHGMCLIKLAMSGALTVEQFNSLAIVRALDPDTNLESLEDKLSTIASSVPIRSPVKESTGRDLHSARIEEVEIESISASAPVTSPIASSVTPTTEISAEQLAKKMQELEEMKAQLSRLIQEQEMRSRLASPISSPVSAGGTRYSTGFDSDDADGREAQKSLVEAVQNIDEIQSTLRMLAPQVEAISSELSSEDRAKKAKIQEFFSETCDFQLAVKLIKKLADREFGIKAHILTEKNIAESLRRPRVSDPNEVSGKKIWELLVQYNLSEAITITGLRSELRLNTPTVNEGRASKRIDSDLSIQKQQLLSASMSETSGSIAAGYSIEKFRRKFNSQQIKFDVAVSVIRQITEERHSDRNPYSHKLSGIGGRVRGKSICISTGLGMTRWTTPEFVTGAKILEFMDNHPDLWERLDTASFVSKFEAAQHASEDGSDSKYADETDLTNLRRAEKRYCRDKIMPSNKSAMCNSTSATPILLTTANGTTITLIPEYSHIHQHSTNVGNLIEQINNGSVTSDTVICLERKQYGNNLGMSDVIKLARTLDNSDNEALTLPASVRNSPMYADALLYTAAKAKGIYVVGIEGKSLSYPKAHPLYHEAREAHMAEQIKEITGNGNNVILLVGAAHIEGLKAMLTGLSMHPAASMPTEKSSSSWQKKIEVSRIAWSNEMTLA